MTDVDPHAPPSTLLDVARAAGVSASTVSRILNGSAKVSDDKRDAVLAAIARMHFAPNQMAQGLKKGCSMTVGIVVQDISSPFFAETLRGIDDGLKDTGYASVIVSGHWNAAEEADRIRLLLARKVDGIILLSGRISDDTVMQFANQRPIVATGRKLQSGAAVGFKLDNEYGAALAVRHLLELGHRQIAFVSGPADNNDASERLCGYRRALEEAGIAAEPGLIAEGDFHEASGLLAINQLLESQQIAEGDFHEASGLLAINQLLESQQQFSAVFAANDLSAYGVRLCLYRKGIRVPDDISLVGFDDLPGSSYTTPPLTTIRQPLYDIGRNVSQALLGLINGEPAQGAMPPLELVVRETTRRLR